MKKDERHTYIRKHSYELARSGEYIDWLSIEWKLRSEGFGEARSLLDNQYIREELNQICNQARSQSEIENRKLFITWINEFVEPTMNQLKPQYSNIHFYKRGNSFSISNYKNELEVFKKFGSRIIEASFHFDESDGRRYKIDSYYSSTKNFDEFTIDDIISLINIVSK